MSPSLTEYDTSLNPTVFLPGNVCNEPSSGTDKSSSLSESGLFWCLNFEFEEDIADSISSSQKHPACVLGVNLDALLPPFLCWLWFWCRGRRGLSPTMRQQKDKRHVIFDISKYRCVPKLGGADDRLGDGRCAGNNIISSCRSED